jgi:hypothetical protein
MKNPEPAGDSENRPIIRNELGEKWGPYQYLLMQNAFLNSFFLTKAVSDLQYSKDTTPANNL